VRSNRKLTEDGSQITGVGGFFTDGSIAKTDFGGCGRFFTDGPMVEVVGRRLVWVVFSPRKIDRRTPEMGGCRWGNRKRMGTGNKRKGAAGNGRLPMGKQKKNG
jgi:hypothetical protein